MSEIEIEHGIDITDKNKIWNKTDTWTFLKNTGQNDLHISNIKLDFVWQKHGQNVMA